MLQIVSTTAKSALSQVCSFIKVSSNIQWECQDEPLLHKNVASIINFRKDRLISSKNQNAQNVTKEKTVCSWERKFRTENEFL